MGLHSVSRRTRALRSTLRRSAKRALDELTRAQLRVGLARSAAGTAPTGRFRAETWKTLRRDRARELRAASALVRLAGRGSSGHLLLATGRRPASSRPRRFAPTERTLEHVAFAPRAWPRRQWRSAEGTRLIEGGTSSANPDPRPRVDSPLQRGRVRWILAQPWPSRGTARGRGADSPARRGRSGRRRKSSFATPPFSSRSVFPIKRAWTHEFFASAAKKSVHVTEQGETAHLRRQQSEERVLRVE